MSADRGAARDPAAHRSYSTWQVQVLAMRRPRTVLGRLLARLPPVGVRLVIPDAHRCTLIGASRSNWERLNVSNSWPTSYLLVPDDDHSVALPSNA
jgi:hypothetical protein